MARHPRCRRVCRLPIASEFVPNNALGDGEEIILSVEEYEALRLIDVEGFSQEECAQYMDVARTTVQQIYSDARKKASQALVLGRVLKIKGGSYRLCSGTHEHCDRDTCKKRGCSKREGAEGP